MNPRYELVITGSGEVRDQYGNLLDFDNAADLDAHIVSTYNTEQENGKWL